MQRVVVIRYRRFGTTYRSHLQGPRIGFLTFLDGQEWDRYVVPKRRQGIATICCVIAQKSAVLVYVATEA